MRAKQPTGEAGGNGDSAGRGRRGIAPYLLVLLIVQIVAYGMVLRAVGPAHPGRRVTLDELDRLIGSGTIRRATVLDFDSRLSGVDPNGRFWVALPRGELAVNNLAGTLANAGVRTDIDQQSIKGLLNFLAQFLLPVLLFFTMFGLLLVLFIGSSGIGGLAMFGRSKARRYRHDDERVTFADVAGMDESVREVEEVKDFLKDPGRFTALGARVPKGVLLIGPPGCGKTLLAKAVAGEADVPFFSVSASEFVEMLVGVGAARVRDLFQEARAAAPSIVFIDELDAVGRSRSGSAFGGNEERDQTLNEMLVQMDGFGPDTPVVVLTATNRPDILDEALTRPGRFDRRIVLDRPDVTGREAILNVHLRGKPVAPEVDVAQIARRTPGFSGADLANVVNEAALLAARRGKARLEAAEVDEAVERVLSGPEQRSRVLNPDEKRRVAVHEAGHALVAWVLPGADPVEKVSVVARGLSLGQTRVVPEVDRFMVTKSQLLDRITMLMAGRLAEVEVLGEASSGAADDLRTATGLARQMVAEFGMSDMPPVAYGRPEEAVAGDRSDRLADQIDAAVTAIVADAERAAATVLRVHRSWLDRLTAELAGLSRGVPAAAPIDAPPAVAVGER